MVLPVIMAEHVLIPLVAGTKHHQLHIIGTQLVHNPLDQIQALLVRQAGNNAHHNLLVVYRQPQLFLQLAFVLGLFLSEVFRVVWLGNVPVRFRVEIVIVNTVDNAPQAVCPCPHQTVQALAVKRHLNLLRISLAYGGNSVGKYNAPFEHVAVFVSLQLVRGEIIVRQTGKPLDCLYIPYALELQVVDGHNGLHVAEKFAATETVL